MIFSFFQKTDKIEFWTYIAHVIFLIICFQSVMVMLLTLLSLWHFRKLWRICDLISVYYLMESYPSYLWIEIFDKLRICCWVWPNFCWANFGKLLVTFLAKIKTTVLLRWIFVIFGHLGCKQGSDLSFLLDILVSFILLVIF